MGAERILGLESEGTVFNLRHCEDFSTLIKIYGHIFSSVSRSIINKTPHDNSTLNMIREIITWKLTGQAYGEWLLDNDGKDGLILTSNNNVPIMLPTWLRCKQSAKELDLEEFFSDESNYNSALTYEAEQDDRHQEVMEDLDEYERDDADRVNQEIVAEIQLEEQSKQMDNLNRIREKRSKRTK